jgi:hypothetical protein
MMSLGTDVRWELRYHVTVQRVGSRSRGEHVESNSSAVSLYAGQCGIRQNEPSTYMLILIDQPRTRPGQARLDLGGTTAEESIRWRVCQGQQPRDSEAYSRQSSEEQRLVPTRGFAPSCACAEPSEG